MHGAPYERKEPLLLDGLEKMIDCQPDTLRGIRNKAMLSLGWAAAARNSEIRTLDFDVNGDGDGFVEFVEGGLVLVLKRRKTNWAPSNWHRIGIPARTTAPLYCPVTLVRNWMEVSEIRQGPLFRGIPSQTTRLKPARFNSHTLPRIVKRSAETLGLPPERYAWKSLRSGCITWLALQGLSPLRIMEHSGHRSMKVMQSYIQPLGTIEHSPLSGTRWCR